MSFFLQTPSKLLYISYFVSRVFYNYLEGIHYSAAMKTVGNKLEYPERDINVSTKDMRVVGTILTSAGWKND